MGYSVGTSFGNEFVSNRNKWDRMPTPEVSD